MRTLGWCHIQCEKGKERKKSIQICIFEIWPTLQPLKPPALLVRRSSHIAICSGYQVTCESFTSPAPQRLLLIISHGVRPPQPESLKCFIYLTSDLSHVTWLLIFNSWRIYTTQRGGEREMHWITLFTHLSSLSAFPNENGAFFLPLTGIISQLTNETSNYSFFFFLVCSATLAVFSALHNKRQIPDTSLRSEVTRVTCLTLPFEHVPIDRKFDLVMKIMEYIYKVYKIKNVFQKIYT